MLEVTPVRDRVVAKGPLYEKGGGRASRLMNESFVPAVAGWGVVAKGFGLITGASDGCGGGVARWRSSFRTYVPTGVSMPEPAHV